MLTATTFAIAKSEERLLNEKQQIKFKNCDSKIILRFGGTNNTFVDCSYILVAPLSISINPSGK